MNGRTMRIQRLLSKADKLVVAAMDHGAFHGPIAGLEQPRNACAKLQGADAVLMSPGMLEHTAEVFAFSGAPTLITRLLWNSSYCFQWHNSASVHQPLLTTAQAIAQGADWVLASLAIRTGNEATDAANAGMFSQCVQDAHALGIPIVGEYYPAQAETMALKDLHDEIRIGARVCAELGADVIKTFYTGERFADIAESVPIPIFVLGAEKTPTEEAALKLAATAARSGARGIVFGRNIVQSRAPDRFIQAVRAVMNSKLSSAKAVRQFKLG